MANKLNLKKDIAIELYHTLLISIIYIIVTLIVAYFIDSFFSFIFEKNLDLDKKHNIRILIEITIQVIICVIAIYIIRKFVKLIPKSLKWGNYNEMRYIYEGEIVIAFIFIGSQPKLLKKINYIVTR